MTDEERESFIAAQAAEFEPDPEDNANPVTYYTDINKLFNHDYHTLITGKTGAGKTTLLLSLLKLFLEKGVTVLHRDDGGLEFIYLACQFKTRVFIPDDPEVSITFTGLNVEVVKFRHPQEIIDAVWKYDYPYNVIVYDVFSLSSAQQAKFYSTLFKYLIFKLQQMKKQYKRKVVFSIDEMNDIDPPRGKGSVEFAGVRADLDKNLKKIRKHKVQLIASSHRFNQISLDTRSQFEMKFIKKCYGYDIWDFLSKNLVSSNNKTFWKMLRKILMLPRNQFVLFDENNKFDFHFMKDIPRHYDNKGYPMTEEEAFEHPERESPLDVEALGSLPEKTKEENGKSAYEKHFFNLMELAEQKGISVEKIAKATKTTSQNLYRLRKKHTEKANRDEVEG